MNGKLTPARKVTISAADVGDWKAPYMTQGTVQKSATSEFRNDLFNTFISDHTCF